MASFPSFYLSSLERKRQRSREMSEGIDKASDSVMGGIDRMGQLEALLHERGDADERKEHGREIEAKNQARADERFGWEKEDRANDKADREMAAAERDELAESTRRMRMGDAIAGVQADVDAEEEVAGDRLAFMRDALTRVADSDVTDTAMMTPEQQLANKRVEGADLDNALKKKRLAGGGGKPDPAKAMKDRLLAAQVAKAEREARGEASSKPRDLSASDVQGLSGTKTTIGRVEKLKALKKGVDTGQLAGRVQSGLASAVEQDKWREFKTLNSIVVKQIGKAVEGGRMTDADAKQYEAILMDPNSDDAEYESVLNLIADDLKSAYEGEIGALEGARFDVPDSLRLDDKKAAASAMTPDQRRARIKELRAKDRGGQ